jgi:hypothetical protein
MNKPPRYLVTDQFDLGMLASLTADITLTEISLADVCQRIEDAEREQGQGLHGGWAAAVKNPVGHFKIPHLWSPKLPQAGP